MENNNNITHNPNTTYKRILKSTFIMGGSSVITTLLGIVRIKIIALLLGPSGMGLTGIYVTITSLVNTISGMGIRESGVRQIAEASGTEDYHRISLTVASIRRAALLSGLAGLCLLLLLSGNVSRLTFGNSEHTNDIALLSLATFFGAVSGGQTALIQGMRRISDLAKLSIIGALMGTIFSIPIIYFFRERGVAFYLLVVAATGILTSWWYSRRIEVPDAIMGWKDALSKARPLLKLGLALMLGAVMTPCTQYLLRTLIVRHDGLSAAGVYHASTTLSVIYVHIILNAMITDFYPRLSAVAHDNISCKSLVNDQVEVGLLLVVPGILAIMTFTPFIITIFYSSQFIAAVDILRWQILGVVLQVVTWPMGFMLRAKGNGKLFFYTELFANSVNLSLSWLGITYFGLVGVGMAYFGMNLSYLIVIYLIVRKNYDFRLSSINLRLLSICILVTGIVFITPQYLSKGLYLILNTGIALFVGIYSIKTIIDKSDSGMVSGFLLKVKTRFSF